MHGAGGTTTTAELISADIDESVVWAQQKVMLSESSATITREIEYRFYLHDDSVRRDNAFTIFADRPEVYLEHTASIYTELMAKNGTRVRYNDKMEIVEAVVKKKIDCFVAQQRRFIVSYAHEVASSVVDIDDDVASSSRAMKTIHCRHFTHRKGQFRVDVKLGLLEIEVNTETDWHILISELKMLSFLLYLPKFPGIMPVALTTMQQVRQIFHPTSTFLVSAKYDGVRVNVHFFQSISSAFFTTRKGRLLLLTPLPLEPKCTYTLDGEYITTRSECIIFDCLHMNHNTAIAQCPFLDRLKMAETMLRMHGLATMPEITFTMKTFHAPHALSTLLMKERETARPQDGLIFNHLSMATTYKWKPEENLTVDLRVRLDGDQFHGYFLNNEQCEQRMPCSLIEDIPPGCHLHDTIVEVRVMQGNKDKPYTLHFVQRREDKHSANYIDVVNDTLKCLQQPITLDTLLTAAANFDSAKKKNQ